MESFDKRQRDRRNAQKRTEKMVRRKERSEEKRQRSVLGESPTVKTEDAQPEGAEGLATEVRSQEPTHDS